MYCKSIQEPNDDFMLAGAVMLVRQVSNSKQFGEGPYSEMSCLPLMAFAGLIPQIKNAEARIEAVWRSRDRRREVKVMAVEAQMCPKCGAAIQFIQGQAEVVCAYCGATVVRSTASAVGVASVEKEIEAEKLIQETVERERRLDSDGRPATAKILTAQTTDIFRSTVEGRAVLMSFAVEVQPDDEAPFSAGTKTLVGLAAVDKYLPGTVLDVRYDPQDHAQVSVEGRHGVPESNPEEQARQMEAQSQAATSDTEDAGSVASWTRLMEAQSQAATPAAEAPTPAWGKPRERAQCRCQPSSTR